MNTSGELERISKGDLKDCGVAGELFLSGLTQLFSKFQ
jgi:hypothetical protein